MAGRIDLVQRPDRHRADRRIPIAKGVEERLDRALAAVAGVARAQARRWIDEGRVRLDGRPVRAARRVAMGEELEANPPDPVRLELVPEPIPLCVLYEDADLIVIDKPPGLVVHPAPGHPRGTLVHALLGQLGLIVLAAIVLLSVGTLLLKATWHVLINVMKFAVGLIRLPFDILLRIFQEA